MIRTTLMTLILVASPARAARTGPNDTQQPRPPQVESRSQQAPETQPAQLEKLEAENRDLKAQLAELEEKLHGLKQAAAAHSLRHLDKIQVGMTRAELFDFLSRHAGRVHVEHDLVTSGTERIVVSYSGIASVTWTRWFRFNPGPSLGWQILSDHYEIPVHVTGSALITLENGEVVMALAG